MSDRFEFVEVSRAMSVITEQIRSEISPHWSAKNVSLALVSPCWRALLKMGRTAADPNAFFSLSALWKAAGSPPGLNPHVHYPAGDIVDPEDGIAMGTVLHRGDRVFADWCTAAWYTHQLDPEVITPDDVVSILI